MAAGWSGAIALWGGDRERSRHELAASRVLAFKLGGTDTLPAAPGLKHMPEPPRSAAAAEVIARGKEMYDATCATCHGVNAVAGVMPDLRYMTPQTHAQFNDIVLRGTRLGGGMAAFGDRYSDADAEAIHAWLIQRANEDWRTESAASSPDGRAKPATSSPDRRAEPATSSPDRRTESATSSP